MARDTEGHPQEAGGIRVERSKVSSGLILETEASLPLQMADLKVLVVEDHEEFRHFIRSFLEGRSYIQVIGEAPDGLDAVQKAEKLRPSLVCLDIGLPKLNGFEAAQQIRRLVPHARLLFMSQMTSAEVIRKAFRLGGQAFVHKARAHSDLLPAIEAVVGGRRYVSSSLEHSEDTEAADLTEDEQSDEIQLRYAAIVESSSDAIIAMTLKGVISAWNPAAQRMYGYRQEEAIGQPIAMIIPPELQNTEMGILKRLQAGELIERYRTRRVSKEGKILDVSLTISPIKNAEGRIIGASKIARDITDIKRAEDELRQRGVQLAAEADALVKLNDSSSRLWKAKSLHEGLEQMLVAAIALLGADKGNVQLFDARRGVLTIAAHQGFDQSFLDFFREVSIKDSSACGRALGSRQIVVVEDIETDEAYGPLRAIARESGYRAVVSKPLIGSGGDVLGMLSMHFTSPHRPTEESVGRLDLYARQATGFIERCYAEHDSSWLQTQLP